MKTNIKDKNKKVNINKMSTFEVSRWAALVEGVNIIAERAAQDGKPFKNVSIKQPALRKYIDSTSDIICRRLIEEEKGK